MAPPLSRDELILAPDPILLAECEVDRYRSSGPGGQHRNKTESAIRLRHKPTGATAHGDERRSQGENKAQAIARLRERLAFEIRASITLETWTPSPRLRALLDGGTAPLGKRTKETPAYLLAMAELLDVFAACGGEVAATGARLGLSTGATSKLLLHDERVHKAVNHLRATQGLKPLR